MSILLPPSPEQTPDLCEIIRPPSHISPPSTMDAIPITKKIIAFGSKKIYLYVFLTPQPRTQPLTTMSSLPSPKFTIALIRTPKLSPYHARFLVPLDFSKYDLRDYLYHAYKVRCFNVRSYVKQAAVQGSQDNPRGLFRPPSEKYMTVEMEQPFVWPATPDLGAWGAEERKAEDDEQARDDRDNVDGRRDVARTLREQAKRVLGGRSVVERGEVVRGKVKGKAKGEAEREGGAVRRVKRVEAWEAARPPSVVTGSRASSSVL